MRQLNLDYSRVDWYLGNILPYKPRLFRWSVRLFGLYSTLKAFGDQGKGSFDRDCVESMERLGVHG